jgi:uncharacterized LabA/DUF88 family protein
MLEHAALADILVLVSGDGDFDILVNKLTQTHGRQVEVYGVLELTAGSLIEAASEYVPVSGDLLLR